MNSIGSCFKSLAPGMLAGLVLRFKRFDLAEEALSHAFEQALRLTERDWQAISSPRGWLMRCAQNYLLDQHRRAGFLTEHSHTNSASDSDPDSCPDSGSDSGRLAMLFLCAHPSLSPDSQAMLMLRFCAGLSIERIAQSFFQAPDAVRRRLHRAKTKLEQSGARFALPAPDLWPARLPPVCSAIEIIYNRSYSDVGGGHEADACAREAEQLCLQLLDQLARRHTGNAVQPSALAEVLGLCALIVLAESRRLARLDADACMIPLDQQDTQRWDLLRIRQAAHWLQLAASLKQPGKYQLRALISAHHARRHELGVTPWSELLVAHQRLQQFDASPMARINHALCYVKARPDQRGLLEAQQEVLALYHAEPKATPITLACCLALAELASALPRKSNAQANTRRDWLQRARAQITTDAERRWLEKQLATEPD